MSEANKQVESGSGSSHCYVDIPLSKGLSTMMDDRYGFIRVPKVIMEQMAALAEAGLDTKLDFAIQRIDGVSQIINCDLSGVPGE